MKHKFLASASLLAAIFLLVMMNLTTPQSVGPFGVLVFFTMLYVVCLGLGVGLARLMFWGRGKVSGKTRVVGRKTYYCGAILAFAPVILVAMGSSGGIGMFELVLVVFLMLLGCFMVVKRL